jgi:hypothetical protein
LLFFWLSYTDFAALAADTLAAEFIIARNARCIPASTAQFKFQPSKINKG